MKPVNDLLNSPQIIWLLGFTIFLGTAVWAYRHLRSYRKLVNTELTKQGHTLVSVETPPAYDTGPFPKIEGPYLQRRSATILGISGQWNTYRIVRYADPSGTEKSAWVRLRYEAFRLKDITWKPKIAPSTENDFP